MEAMMTRDEQVAWMRQWHAAAVALADDEKARLAALTEEDAWAQSEVLLALATPVSPTDPRHSWSGLVEQQALLHRRPRS
jgi:hypothetical protein